MIRPRLVALLVVLLAIPGRAVSAAEGEHVTVTDPAKADADYALQGEYVGQFDLGDGVEQQFGMQLIALGGGKFHVVAYIGGLPGAGWDGFTKLDADAEAKDGVIEIMASEGSATLKDGVITVKNAEGSELGSLKKTERTSETLGAVPPEGAVVLFDGKAIDKWVGAKLTEEGFLSTLGAPWAVTKQKFQDFTLHLEFRTPYMPTATGQARGNSGVYLQNRYECQVLDSFGLEGLDNECGGFYQLKSPDVNMCLPPLAWQTYDIEFTAARWGDAPEKDAEGKEILGDDGKPKLKYQKIKNAVVTVKHNGVVIHDNYELPKFTPGGEPGESDQPGPLMLQNHGNPVHYRNIWIVEKKAE